MLKLRYDSGERYSRKYVGVVALSRFECLALVFYGIERTTGAEDASSFRVNVRVLGRTFRARSRVGESKNHGSVVGRCHVLQNGRSERAGYGRRADDYTVCN